MNTSKRATSLLWLSVSLLVLGSEGCVTIQEGTPCTVAGKLSAGSICAHLLATDTLNLSFKETIDFLEAQPERTCVPVPGMQVCKDDQSTGTPILLKARGAAILMSASDWGTMKSELEVACRQLGKACSYATQKTIKKLSVPGGASAATLIP